MILFLFFKERWRVHRSACETQWRSDEQWTGQTPSNWSQSPFIWQFTHKNTPLAASPLQSCHAALSRLCNWYKDGAGPSNQNMPGIMMHFSIQLLLVYCLLLECCHILNVEESEDFLQSCEELVLYDVLTPFFGGI